MPGMTRKRFARFCFYRTLEEYREAKKDLSTDEKRAAFVVLSVQIHTLKGHVPKRLWPLINK